MMVFRMRCDMTEPGDEPSSSRAGVEIMGTGLRTEIFMALAWLMFPLVPVLLEELYYQVSVNLFGSSRSGPDPVDWGWSTWILMLGPLLGYGFLAGSTAEVPDEVAGPRRGLRRVVARRTVWVAIGPWYGFLVVLSTFLALDFLNIWAPLSRIGDALGSWRDGRVFAVLSWVWTAILLGIVAYGWLWPAWASLRRAARIGLWGRALYRGVVTALAFVGSLFGGFWAITSAWRSFFFDPRVTPMIAMALSVVVLSGCSSTITYGEMRRRELFHAMLLAWVFGLALIWWWSSRRRSERSRPRDANSGGRRLS
jgi:hypothetical protein